MAKYNWRAHKNTRIRFFSTTESGDSLINVSGNAITFNSPGTYSISWSGLNFSTSPVLTEEVIRQAAATIIERGLEAPRSLPVHPSVISAFGNWPAEE